MYQFYFSPQRSEGGSTSQPTPPTGAAIDKVFVYRLKRLFIILQPYTALWLVALSLVDAYLGSKVIDRDMNDTL